jgi:putative ubiquitin-RnfH superfamily antitoxin RatB of RatAB toxin-antitoxin module
MPLCVVPVSYSVATESSATIAVLYALPAEQPVVELAFEPGMTAAMAVERSGLIQRYPEIASSERVLGVWGVEVVPESALRAGDRVEISRPLVADPRQMRREFLTDGRVMGGAAAPDSRVRKSDRE